MVTDYRHRDWLIWAIVSTVLGVFLSYTIGFLFGGIGIIFSALANSAYKSGNIADAQEKNRTAKIMTIISLVINGIGLLFILLLILLYFTLGILWIDAFSDILSSYCL